MKILLFFFLFSFIVCMKIDLKYADLCFIPDGKGFICHGKLNFGCSEFLCVKNQYNCQLLSMFSQNKMKYLSFMNKVEDCPEPPKYKWSPNHVCVNVKQCVKPSVQRLWSTQIKLIECKCIGKYNYICNEFYCGLNKQACDGLIKNKQFTAKKCIL